MRGGGGWGIIFITLGSGGSRRGAQEPAPLPILGEKEMTEGEKASKVSKSKPGHPLRLLAQGLDPPLLGSYNFQLKDSS